MKTYLENDERKDVKKVIVEILRSKRMPVSTSELRNKINADPSLLIKGIFTLEMMKLRWFWQKKGLVNFEGKRLKIELLEQVENKLRNNSNYNIIRIDSQRLYFK